jgi:hypothetical protein
MINVKAIRKIEEAKTRVRKETYRKIYEQFCRKIQNAVTLGNKQVMLQVPPVLLGFPMYSIESAGVYLKRQLELAGFHVTAVNAGVLYVSWLPQTSKKSPPPQTAEPSDESLFDDTLPTLINLKKAANRARMR